MIIRRTLWLLLCLLATPAGATRELSNGALKADFQNAAVRYNNARSEGLPALNHMDCNDETGRRRFRCGFAFDYGHHQQIVRSDKVVYSVDRNEQLFEVLVSRVFAPDVDIVDVFVAVVSATWPVQFPTDEHPRAEDVITRRDWLRFLVECDHQKAVFRVVAAASENHPWPSDYRHEVRLGPDKIACQPTTSSSMEYRYVRAVRVSMMP